MDIHSLTQIQTGRAIIENTLKLYLRYFPIFVLIVAIPLLPTYSWDNYQQLTGNDTLLDLFVILLVDPISTLPCAMAIAEVCLGNRPGVLRAYGRLFRRVFWKLALTYLIWTCGTVFSFLLLVIPGFFFLAWYMFVLPIIVLEGHWGLAAFKRSAKLSAGFIARNLGLLMLVVAAQLILVLIGEEAAKWVLPTTTPPVLSSIVTAFSTVVFEPLTNIVLILLYLDMRARKEASDGTALVEDLMR